MASYLPGLSASIDMLKVAEQKYNNFTLILSNFINGRPNYWSSHLRYRFISTYATP